MQLNLYIAIWAIIAIGVSIFSDFSWYKRYHLKKVVLTVSAVLLVIWLMSPMSVFHLELDGIMRGHNGLIDLRGYV